MEEKGNEERVWYVYINNLVKMGTCFSLKWSKTAGVHCCSSGERQVAKCCEKM